MYGMCFSNGTFTAQNNLVRIGIAGSGVSTAGASQVVGIRNASTRDGVSFYHNSVYVGGMQTSENSTFAFNTAGINNGRDFRHNIFVNARSNNDTTSGDHQIVHYDSSTDNIGIKSDYNFFFSSAPRNIFGSFGPQTLLTLDDWRYQTPNLDHYSTQADPLFVNPTGDAATLDLHLQYNSPAFGDNRTDPDENVTDDFDGLLRSTTKAPTAGALEFTVPTIKSSSANFLANSLTIFITGTGFAPFISNNLVVFNGGLIGTITVATPTKLIVSITNPEILNSLIGSALKVVVTSNGVPSGAPVQIGTVVPAAIITGTVTVGPGGNYPNLTGKDGFFAAVSSVGAAGNLVVKITGDTSEDGSADLYEFNTFTLMIQPDSATKRTISGPGAEGLIRLSGSRRVTIDGSFDGHGRYLTFRNTNELGSTISFMNDASDNSVINCVLEGSTTNTLAGVIFFSTGVTTGNNHNAITGNQIRNRSDSSNYFSFPSYLIFSRGASEAIANRNNTISQNEIFNFRFGGVVVGTGSESWSIVSNTVYTTIFSSISATGINSSSSGSNSVLGNLVFNLLSPSAIGIQVGGLIGNTTVAGNRVWNIGGYPGGTGFDPGSVFGIVLSSVAGQSVSVVNNMVSLNISGFPTDRYIYGIADWGKNDSFSTIANNSVLLSGISTGSQFHTTWAFHRERRLGQSTGTVKNNLFLNLRTGATDHFAATQPLSSAGAMPMDYNVYAGTGRITAAKFFESSNGTPIDFAAWQAAIPTDTHSSASNPGGNYTSAMFVDPANGDLHLKPGGNVLVNDKGIPQVGVTTDYDGQPRGLFAPDIGADESAPSANANLSALTLSSGPLNPLFETNTKNYTTTVGNLVTSVIVTPAKADPNASLSISGGGALAVGSNTLTILVTAQDGSTTKTYTVIVTRAPNPLSFSGYTLNAIRNKTVGLSLTKILAHAATSGGGTLGIPAVVATSAQGGSVSLSGSSLIYVPPNNYTGLDTFSVTIADGLGNTIPATIAVTVSGGSGQSGNQAQVAPLQGGGMATLHYGIPGRSYLIERSTDLLNWTTLATLIAAPDGSLPYTDPSPPLGSAFYRTRTP